MTKVQASGARRDPPPAAWWTSALVTLFVVSLGWKLYCLRRHVVSPLFGDLSADAETYWMWAKILVRGGWIGHNPFFLGPLYPYWLALFRPSTASSSIAPLVVQCVLGAATVVLVARSARIACAPAYAIVAGGLTAGYAMATLLDQSLLAESVLWFLGAVFLHLQLAVARGDRIRCFPALSGLLIGCISLARPSGFLLLGPHVAALASSRGWRRGLRAAALAAICAVGLCLPVLLRHVALGHGWILTTYSLGYNAYVGNGPDANGVYVPSIDDAGLNENGAGDMEGGVRGDGREFISRTRGLKLSPLASSSYWLQQTWAHVRASPMHALRLLCRKGALGLNHVEAYQIDNIHVRERIDGPLGLPLLGEFGVVGVLGLLGLFMLRRVPAGSVLIAHAFAMWVPMVGFFVTDRYRHQLALPLLVACGPAIGAVVDAVRASRDHTARLVPVALAFAVAAAVVWLPLVPFDREQVEFESHRMLGESLLAKGRIMEGEAELQKCLEPGSLSRLPLHRSAAARAAVAGVLNTLGSSLAQRGDYAESERALGAAVRYAPETRGFRRDHAVVLAMAGMRAAAVAECDTLGTSAALLAGELLRLAEHSASAAAWGPAEQALRAAIDMDSTSEAANVVLLRLLRSQGREREAHALVLQMRGRGVSQTVMRREAPELEP